MSCCSGRREAFSSQSTFRAAPVAPALSSETSLEETLTYSGRDALALRGPFSGRIYHVGAGSPRLVADSRDVEALLRTGQFSKA
jgi:hypothetical protein